MTLNRNERLQLGEEAKALGARLGFLGDKIADAEKEAAIVVVDHLAAVSNETARLAQKYAAAVRSR